MRRVLNTSLILRIYVHIYCEGIIQRLGSEPGLRHEAVVQLQRADVLVGLILAESPLARDDLFERAAHLFGHVLRIARQIEHCSLAVDQLPQLVRVF
jgi:hypothetical protein